MIGTKYIGAIYYNSKGKGILFVGKIDRRFLEDKNGPGHSMELDCLKPAIGRTTVLDEIPRHLERDIGLFPIYDIMSGPLKMKKLTPGRWSVPGYPKLRKTFQIVEKMNLQREYRNLFH